MPQFALTGYDAALRRNSGIESTISIVRGRARKNQVELITELSPLPGVTCDPARINQVLLNLIVNAVDACENGGAVTIRSRATGEHVEIEVTDTGCGIPIEIRDKIFEPFFPGIVPPRIFLIRVHRSQQDVRLPPGDKSLGPALTRRMTPPRQVPSLWPADCNRMLISRGVP